MHSITLQIHPKFVTNFNQGDFLIRVRSAGRSPEIDSFTERDGTYLNFTFFTEFPQKLWQDLRAALYDNPEYSAIISPISIAVYEDESSPNNYKLLHHFDSTEILDTL